jgi:hypothetical protein
VHIHFFHAPYFPARLFHIDIPILRHFSPHLASDPTATDEKAISVVRKIPSATDLPYFSDATLSLKLHFSHLCFSSSPLLGLGV